MTHKNIAFVHEFFPKGGAEVVTSLISNYLITNGYTVYVFATSIDQSQLMEGHSDVVFLTLPNRNVDSKENGDFIIRTVNAQNISFLLSKDINNQLSYIKSKTSCKVIYTNHSTPLWELNLKYSLGRDQAKRSFLKMIEWYLLRLPKYKLFGTVYKKIKKNYKQLYDSVDVYTVLCDAYGRQIADIVDADYSGSKIETLINPVIMPSQTINLNKKKQIVYTGRLNYDDKRVDRLLDIWSSIYAAFPEWELLIIGEGNEEKNLKQQAERLNLKNYTFCGYQKNVGHYLQDASILCLTSTTEGWGLSLTEAQIYGVVPVAFACSDGVKTILSPSGTNGVLVKPFDKQQYANKLSELMSDEDLRKKIQVNIMNKAKSYHLETIGKQWDQMFKKMEF